MSVICFVSYEIHPTTMGGCGVLIHHAADVLLSSGHEVVLLLDVPPEHFRQFMDRDRLTFPKPENCRAYRVDDLCDDFPFTVGDVPCIFQWKSLRFAHALAKVEAKERLDFIEFFEYCGAGYYAMAERLYANDHGPVLGSRLHGSLEVLDRYGQGVVKDLDRLVLHGLERRSLALSETVLAPSRTYYERYYQSLYDLEPARVVVSSPPKQPFARVQRPDPSGPFTIAFIGRMFHLKGVDQLVHAAVLLFKQRPDLDCTIDLIGYDSDDGPVPGSYTKYLQSLIPARLRKRFVFSGHLTHDQLAEHLGKALFAVFPNRIESFCYALHEAYDAGVPVVINDLPAFRDFFEDGRNAIVYDGTTSGLLAAMKKMIDDGPSRERLCRPYPVAEHPIGHFYDRPVARLPLGAAAHSASVSPLVVVLCDGPDFQSCAAIRSLALQTVTPQRTICLVPSQPDGEEVLWWLGRSWHVRSVEGEPVEASDVVTTDALAVVRSDDHIDPQWLELCSRALGRRAGMAFAGAWIAADGRVVPVTLDIAPELYPFQSSGQLARVLVRTEPGAPISDIFDSSLGSLGHTGYLWWAIAKWGHGVLLPKSLIHTTATAAASDASALRALVMRFGEPLSERLSIIAGLLYGQGPSKPTAFPLADASVEQKVQLADELGGRTLARLALKKLARRVVK
jgi:glycosyltransferase involved in cell wall biosynthesis